MFKTNHVATNLITKGFINSFPLTNGILENLEYEIITISGKKHGGISYAKLNDDISYYGVDDISAIKVWVNWRKNIKENPNITVELLENRIYAELLDKHGEGINRIKIEVIKLD
jgi:hypothetical protein